MHRIILGRASALKTADAAARLVELVHLAYYRIWFLKIAPRMRQMTGSKRPRGGTGRGTFMRSGASPASPSVQPTAVRAEWVQTGPAFADFGFEQSLAYGQPAAARIGEAAPVARSGFSYIAAKVGVSLLTAALYIRIISAAGRYCLVIIQTTPLDPHKVSLACRPAFNRVIPRASNLFIL